MPTVEYTEQTNIIITVLNDVTVGLVVDTVSNVIRLEDARVATLPEFNTVNVNRYLSSVFMVADKLVMNLNCEAMLNDDLL